MPPGARHGTVPPRVFKISTCVKVWSEAKYEYMLVTYVWVYNLQQIAGTTLFAGSVVHW